MPVIKYNYNALRAQMHDKGVTQKECAERIGVSESHFCQKMAGNFDFKQSEIAKLCDLLGIEISNVKKFFFTPES